MAQALHMSPPPPLRDPHTARLSSPSPRPTRSTSTLSASSSPPPVSRSASPFVPSKPSNRRRQSGAAKENVPVEMDGVEDIIRATPAKGKMNGKAVSGTAANADVDLGNGGGRTWRDGSIEPEEDVVRRRNPARAARGKSPGPNSVTSHNGLPTLETIPDPQEDDGNASPSASVSSHPPPPAPSAATGTEGRPVTRKRRSSSIKRKPSPGVTPTKVVDWEIPRKALHSSIGFFTLFLNHLNPPTVAPLLVVLSTALVSVFTIDLARLRFPAFAELWEVYLGFLMRESERQKINGVVWYLVGVIFVLSFYPRDVAVVSILTLSWSDTTASTIGRLWGRYTPPLPPHVPGIKLLKFAPRKSLAGFLAATVTGSLICLGFWWTGSNGRWDLLDGQSWVGLLGTAGVVGVGGAVVEALDLGLDDNLTLPILSGAVIWLWLAVSNALFGSPHP
ncbi:DAG kinase 1 [Saitozyma sp. JCM 24511]|nr:DAG kinase 1 [Saitozyma sp. JCM 24511]